MAKPDLNNGHFLQLSHEILERLIHCNLSGREFRIVLYVVRMTYGFKRKSAEISSSEMADFVGIDAGDSRRLLSLLCDRRILVKYSSHRGVKPASYGLEKDWEKWDFGDRKALPELIASRGIYTTTSKTQRGSKHHDKQGENTTTSAVKTPRLTGSKHHDYAAEVTIQDEPNARIIKNKEQRIKYPPTPEPVSASAEGGVSFEKSLREKLRTMIAAWGWQVSKKDLDRAEDLVRGPTPAGWDKVTWRRHSLVRLYEQVQEIEAELTAGAKIYSPVTVGAHRAKTRLAIDAKLPQNFEQRKEAI